MGRGAWHTAHFENPTRSKSNFIPDLFFFLKKGKDLPIMQACSAAQPVWPRDRQRSRVTGERAGRSRKKAVMQGNKMLFFTAVTRKAQKQGATFLFF